MWSPSDLRREGLQPVFTALKNKFVKAGWGSKSLAALYASVVSGLVLALQYDPAVPFYSVSAIDVLIPFGAFWRALHFYASQLFFLLSLTHLAAIFVSGQYRKLYFPQWTRLILATAVGLLLLFSGYVLRGDATGQSAGVIAEHLALSIPLAGQWFNNLLFAISSEGLKRVYANHLIGFGVLWLGLSWDHIRRFKVNWREHGPLILGMIIVSLIFNAPLEPEKLGVFHVPGPWFFLGLQELLRYMRPFWAGIVFPLLFLLALILLAAEKNWQKRAFAFAPAWIIVYILLTAVSLTRG